MISNEFMISGFKLEPDFKYLIKKGYLIEADLDGFTEFEVGHTGLYEDRQQVKSEFGAILSHYGVPIDRQDTLLFICLIEQMHLVETTMHYEEVLRLKEQLLELIRVIIACQEPIKLKSLGVVRKAGKPSKIEDHKLIAWVGESLLAGLSKLNPILPTGYLELLGSTNCKIFDMQPGDPMVYEELAKLLAEKKTTQRTYNRRCVANFLYRLCSVLKEEKVVPNRDGGGFSNKVLTAAAEIGDLLGWDTLNKKGSVPNSIRKLFGHYQSSKKP